MSKIVIISPFQEFTELVKKVIQDSNYRLYGPKSGQDLSFEESIEIAREEVNRGAEVIITRGGTVQVLRQTVDIPVIEAKIDILDILRTLEIAKQRYRAIGLVGPENVIVDYKELGEYLNIQVYPIFSYETDLELQIRRAMVNGVEIILGDGMSVNCAKTFGLPGIKLIPTENSIREAINQAENVLLARFLERQQNEQLHVVLETAQDGILVISKHGHITLINRKSTYLLNLESDDVINKHADQVLPQELLLLLSQEREMDGEVITLPEFIISISKRYITVGEEIVGSVVTLQDVTQIQKLEHTIRKKLHKKGFIAKASVENIVASSAVMKQLLQTLHQYSKTDSTILINGETGTGKELVAQSIHNLSSRNNRPFVAINCGALPANLLESELFGYEPGAFTGANRSGKEGLFELAHTGTIFLDEIGELPIQLQTRLLRVIQEKEVMRLGGSSIIPVNVRIIAATHRKLRESVRTGTFREDLFYRLNVLNLTLPPLRERREDIPHLAVSLLQKVSHRHQRVIPGLPDDFLQFLQNYNWPGNIRELENVLEKVAVLSVDGNVEQAILEQIKRELIGLEQENESAPTANMNHDHDDQFLMRRLSNKTLKQLEEMMIRYQLDQTGGNKDVTSQQLGISRATLWRKLKSMKEQPSP